MLFRNYTYEDLKRLKQIDCFSYLMSPHFTNELPPDIPYSNDVENIQTESNKDRIAQTIKQYKNRANK